MTDRDTLILLKRLLSRSRSTDPLLEQLVTVCSEQSSFSVSIALGLTVSGVPHRGLLDAVGPFVNRIDDTLLIPFDKLDPAQTSPNQEILSVLAEVFRGRQFSTSSEEAREQRRKTLAQLQERLPDGMKPSDIESLPDDLIDDAIAYLDRQVFVQLKEAEVLLAGTWTPVGLIRISVAKVGSWWVLDEQWNH